MVEQKKQFDRRPGGPQNRMRRPRKRLDREKDEFQQKMVDLARVTRVMAGGKRMKFRACMVVGDGKGQVGVAVAKGADVAGAIAKAVGKAKKHLITVPIIDGTLPHEVTVKFKAAKLLIKPAKKGNGIKAGGVVRIVLDLAGVKDAVGKILGSSNKVNNVTATIQALSSFKSGNNKKPIKKVEAKPAVESTDDKKEDKK
jgi:small subunit ribosomal protein S5